MKPLLVFAAFAAGVLTMFAADTPVVTYIAHDKVNDVLTKSGLPPLVKQQDLTVQGGHRVGPGQVEVHDKETDIFYVTEGDATIVTGGKMIGGKANGANQWLGTEIQGGETHKLGKGDVMVIPAGIPHWFKEVSPSINYFVVKVLKP